MPRFDGTGPRGEGMFTGRGEGYCVLRWPEPGSVEPADGYAGIEGRPVQFAPGTENTPAVVQAGIRTYGPDRSFCQGRRRRCGRLR